MRSVFFLIPVFMVLSACHQRQATDHKPSITDSVYGERTACLLSQLAYHKTAIKEISNYLPGWKIVWDGQTIGGNYAFVATNNTGYAIAIRGSLLEFSYDALQNWVYQDLHVMTLRSWPYCNDSVKGYISQGSWDGWRHLSEMKDKASGRTLLSFLESKVNSKTPLLITGHSLGGNLATVYGSYLWQEFKRSGEELSNMNVITFAAPAAGNFEFASDFDKKFPNGLRYENSNDLVPKFPCNPLVKSLGKLYDSIPSASTIMVGYENKTVSLSNVFTMLNIGLGILQLTNGNADYTQPCGDGKRITVPLSGRNINNDIQSWLSEAGYHHSIEQYAVYLGVPIIR
jgi:triacylglycerol lipase